jgi:hypothetical protein
LDLTERLEAEDGRMKFRKKPVSIDAIQYTKELTARQLLDFITFTDFHLDGVGIVIHTLEGEMRANLGDWIIKGVKGEFYPCKPDIFDMYEPMEAEDDSISRFTE